MVRLTDALSVLSATSFTMSLATLLLILLATETLFATLVIAELDIDDLDDMRLDAWDDKDLDDLDDIDDLDDLDDIDDLDDLDDIDLDDLDDIDDLDDLDDIDDLDDELGRDAMISLLCFSAMISSATASALTDSPVETRCSTTACTSS
jgi:hypothetical protein